MSDSGPKVSEIATNSFRGVPYMTGMSDYPDQDSIPMSDCANLISVPDQLPVTSLDDPRIGLQPAMALSIASALSRFVCETKSPLMRPCSYLGHTLNRYATTSVAGSPALIPNPLAQAAIPVASVGEKRFRVRFTIGETLDNEATRAPGAPRRVLNIVGQPADATATLRRLGLSFAQLQACWQERLDADGVNAMLDVEVLTAFFVPAFWPVVAAFISDGPGVATERMERLLREEAGRPIKPTRSRPEGGVISKGQLSNYEKAGTRLMAKLIDLHHRGHASTSALAAWTAKPKMQTPDAEDGVTDTTAPPLRVLRLAWARLNADIEQWMRVPLPEELDAVPSLGARQRQHLFERLRKRVLFTLLFCLGARIDAIERLKVGDFQRRRRLPDGSVGPVIALRPRKTHGKDDVRHKPLPPLAALVIETWLAFLEVKLGRPQGPESPLLIPACTRSNEPWTDAAMRQCIGGGVAGQPGKKRYQAALLPKENERHGYSPHTVRGAVTQGVRSKEAAAFLTEHGLKDDAVFQVLIAEVLTDRKDLGFDSLGYGGAKKRTDRERLSGYGAHIMWELVTTARGARRVLDAEDFRSALHKRAALEGELAKVRREMAELYASSESGGEQVMLTTLLHSQHLGARKDQLDDELRAVERDLNDLRHNPKRKVTVPDDVEELPVIDLDAIEREVLGGIAAHRRHALRSVRDPAWVTPKELAFVLDVGEATARRWVDGKLPTAAHKRPWRSPEESPVDNTLGVKRRRIAVTGINPGLLDSDAKRQRLAETQARWPEGWSEEQVNAPLRIGPARREGETAGGERHLRAVA
jgi:hypothetical protein